MLTTSAEKSFSFHRADMQKVFLTSLESPEVLHLGKRFVSYSQESEDDPITVTFQDGSTTTCDILVGCDGIRSTMRAAMYTRLADLASAAGNDDEAAILKLHIPPKWTGTVVYRCLLRKSDLPDETVKHPAIAQHSLVVVSGRA